MTDHVHLSRFTPSRTPPDVLEAIFVQRQDLAADTVERIRESALTGNKHHILLVGPRGSGKTHFVSLVYHRINGDDELRDRLRIAWLNEDETSTSFLDVLLRIWRALQDKYPEEFAKAALQPIYDLKPDDAEKSLRKLLLVSLGKHTLLVIIENLDDVFNGIGEEGQQKLRSVVQENPAFTILATTQQLFEDVTQRTSPFFGFFQTEHLKPLSLDDAVELMRKIAIYVHEDEQLAAFLMTPAGRARVRALHQLAGGNPRIYITLSEFANREELDELAPPFENMLDELTPYYQHRIDCLAPQQRKIVEFLCTRQRPVPVKEIARRLFTSNQSVAAQLKELRERRYVISHQRGRESLYELTEPLMRMSFEVKENRREPIRLIVDFLRIWYERDELASRLLSLSTDADLSRRYVTAALERYETEKDDPRIRPLLNDLETAEANKRYEDAVEIARDLVAIRGTAWDSVMLGCQLHSAGRYDDALAAYDVAITIDPQCANGWNNRGTALAVLGRLHEALESYQNALAFEAHRESIWINLGGTLVDLGRFQEALTSFDKGLEINPQSASAWHHRGVALRRLGRVDEAVDCFDKAISLDRRDPYPALGRAATLISMGRWNEGWEGIDLVFKQEWRTDWDCAMLTESLIEAILDSTRDSDIWITHAERFVTMIAAHKGLLAPFGIGLVRSLAALTDDMFSNEGIEVWRRVWVEVCHRYLALGVALRMFDVGIRYLQTKDPKTLLDLNAEERPIVAEVLGIDLDEVSGSG